MSAYVRISNLWTGSIELSRYKLSLFTLLLNIMSLNMWMFTQLNSSTLILDDINVKFTRSIKKALTISDRSPETRKRFFSRRHFVFVQDIRWWLSM